MDEVAAALRVDDHGANNPTAWHAWTVDHDGNLVAFDEYYSPGLSPGMRRRSCAAGVTPPVTLSRTV